MFNLTKRQLICFTGGALIGVPLFFLLRKPTGNSVAAMCMMLVMLPFFMPVSYTHLDVYKRQCVDTAARFNERTEERMLQNRPQTRHKKEELSR